MFRRSKRDKERRRGSSFNTNDSSDETASNSSQTGSLKRATKLFGFGKKDKRKSVDNGKESPELENGHSLRIEEVSERAQLKIPRQRFSPVHENVQSRVIQNYMNGKGTRLDIYVPSTPDTIEHKSRTNSEGSSLNFDFATDSLSFSDFTADVLKATEEKLKGVDLKLPELKAADKDTSRIICVNRTSTGDFGFTIRRSTIQDGTKIVHTIEPTGQETFGLLPGDRIVEVNGENVENCRRDNIIDRIEMSGRTNLKESH